MANDGYTILSVGDRKLEDFNWEWMIEQIDKHNPRGIEMSKKQFLKLVPQHNFNMTENVTLKGIPVRFIKHSFFGVDLENE